MLAIGKKANTIIIFFLLMKSSFCQSIKLINDGKEKIFISSGDWMTRNLDNRSEVAVPIYDEAIRKQIKDIISIQLSGNTKVRIIDRKQDNFYKKAKPGEKKVRVQDEIYNYLKNEAVMFLKSFKSKK